ncbi:ABC transporter permease [Nocardioides insulae]|uniref:ABC transporter permease n=1 Tax=Nocardioides insulae TaxID=394734 RepID=UPI0004183570|nr:ABC transporter permease subunit [Nocardioides insulae]
MWQFIQDRWQSIAFDSYQHASLVIQCVLLATIIAVALAAVIARTKGLEPIAGALSAIGLTIPSFALIGILIPVTQLGTTTAVVVVTFYAFLPVLRNAVVGLAGVDRTLVESARGMGMGSLAILMRVQLPLAWPVIHAGIRISTQMSMGVAAISAYVLGPGLGKYTFDALATEGSANSMYNALIGVFGVVIIALIVDALLLLLGRLTISKGIRIA